MRIVFIILGIALIVIILGDAFETVIFPRRVTRRLRLARLFYRYTWRFWSALVRTTSSGKHVETHLSFYGPISLILLLTLWAIGLVVGFGLLYWGTGSPLRLRDGTAVFFTDLYMSGTTFFTLGLGDVTPRTTIAKVFVVIEGGMGFGFLALLIGYLPALNQSFSRREVNISLLDGRAGSPPTATEMLRRHNYDHGLDALQQLLHEWERWSAEFLESHLSYPVLAYFRSQHDNQSWLGALTAILDTSALVIVGLEGACARQAELTFAMARHAVVDLSIVFNRPPESPKEDRLPASGLADLREALTSAGLQLREGPDADRELSELRRIYEPYVYSLSRYFCVELPPWMPAGRSPDNWQVSVWGSVSNPEKDQRQREPLESGHF